MNYIYEKGNDLVLKCVDDISEENWIKKQFADRNLAKIRKAFNFKKSDIIDQRELDAGEEEMDGFEYNFRIGTKVGSYYKLSKSVFGIENDIYIKVGSDFTMKHFVTTNNASVIKRLDDLIIEPLYIGGDESGNGKIPSKEYNELLKLLPNGYEVKLYSNARIESTLSNFLETKESSTTKFNNYLNKKLEQLNNPDLAKLFDEYEIQKLNTILEHLEDMLKSERKYSEKQWQDQILNILILLFPKYIAVFKEVKFKDIYSGKTRRLDYVLVDYLGHIDIIEIKKPMESAMISNSHYRDNHIPKRELSGTIMQIEKYIYYLNKWGKKGEDELTKEYKNCLPKGMKIRITNPNGLIVMGRENNLTIEQLSDLEIIKRKYKNVIDIISYDDLIKRIKITIEQMSKV
ncbi:Shedu immune nuclease family protein [Jiulongibacter sediminis]|uniref:Shedu protein SduA C-terminal domain-containing protein n=1 Tax=Jiulongibacter sediminis TaxID=1605367 RepID=A0A0P7BXB2_9BACT|nr:Shedu immune nuclease family protein [Jiulongibacter sediminis]KPM46760.1 hypothetical protein AFM12_18550 [Jiulongibacter sediminis]TBX21664.1 hypothetical protein TK44_18555 [Jiulongibacter sediminis]